MSVLYESKWCQQLCCLWSLTPKCNFISQEKKGITKNTILFKIHFLKKVICKDISILVLGIWYGYGFQQWDCTLLKYKTNFLGTWILMQAFLTLLDFHGIKVTAWKQTLKWRYLSRSLALRQAPRIFYIDVLYDLRGIFIHYSSFH